MNTNQLSVVTIMPIGALLQPSTFEHFTFTDPETAWFFFCDHLDPEIDIPELEEDDDMPVVIQCNSFIIQLARFKQMGSAE